jgi:hypothetical protein
MPPAAGITGARITRRCWLLAAVALPLCQDLRAQSLLVRANDGRLHVAAQQLHFINAKTLERLRNGASVRFNFQLAALTDRLGQVLDRALEQFVVSYDLWEEKFSVARPANPPRSVSHLTAQAAEAWCVDNISLLSAALPADKPLWIRLEVRVEDPADRAAVVGESGINLARLIEIFSRPARAQETRFVEEAGPLRLADLKRQK